MGHGSMGGEASRAPREREYRQFTNEILRPLLPFHRHRLARDREGGKAAALSARGSFRRDRPSPSQLLQHEILCP